MINLWYLISISRDKKKILSVKGEQAMRDKEYCIPLFIQYLYQRRAGNAVKMLEFLHFEMLNTVKNHRTSHLSPIYFFEIERSFLEPPHVADLVNIEKRRNIMEKKKEAKVP